MPRNLKEIAESITNQVIFLEKHDPKNMLLNFIQIYETKEPERLENGLIKHSLEYYIDHEEFAKQFNLTIPKKEGGEKPLLETLADLMEFEVDSIIKSSLASSIIPAYETLSVIDPNNFYLKYAKVREGRILFSRKYDPPKEKDSDEPLKERLYSYYKRINKEVEKHIFP